MRRMKKGSAIILAAALVFSALALPEAYAAGPIDVSRTDCAMTINCGMQIDAATGTSISSSFDDVKNEEFDIKIFRVATVDVSGKYTAVDAFKNVELFTATDDNKDTVSFGKWVNEKLTSTTPSSEWADVAVALKALTAGADLSVTTDDMDPYQMKTKTEGSTSVEFTGLETGLYLIDAQRLLTDQYRYEFSPYLISLPNNYYYENVEKAESSNPPIEVPANADEWIYNLKEGYAIGLKPARFDRYGYIKIEKDVPVLNIETPGEVFVYEVTAKAADDTVVYNDVVTIDYSEKHYVMAGPIPAMADVTVEEVYKGASYVKVSSSALSTIVQAETFFDDCDTYEAAKAKAATISENDIKNELIFKYTNEHNNIPNGGTGVTNTITSNMVQNYEGQGVPTWNLPQQ